MTGVKDLAAGALQRRPSGRTGEPEKRVFPSDRVYSVTHPGPLAALVTAPEMNAQKREDYYQQYCQLHPVALRAAAAVILARGLRWHPADILDFTDGVRSGAIPFGGGNFHNAHGTYHGAAFFLAMKTVQDPAAADDVFSAAMAAARGTDSFSRETG